MNNDQPLRFGLLPRYISWLTIVLALLAFITFFAVSNPRVQYATRMMGFGGGVEYSDSSGVAVPPMAVGGYAQDGSVSYPDKGMMTPGSYPYPYPNPEVPVSDMREFLKTYYSASMRTRDVPALTRRVETTVRGYEGRIDSESSSEKYGYVSFALPQVKYDAFRTELEGMVGSRFLTINISSQNLLSQKVSIEEQQKQADAALVDYRAARQRVVAAHAAAVQALQAKIDAPETTADEKLLFEKNLVSENASYTKQLNYADANITYAQNWVKGVKTQDATLLANVATVQGTVSISWISFWDMAQLYLPGYWIPAIFAVLAVLSYSRDRARARKY